MLTNEAEHTWSEEQKQVRQGLVDGVVCLLDWLIQLRGFLFLPHSSYTIGPSLHIGFWADVFCRASRYAER